MNGLVNGLLVIGLLVNGLLVNGLLVIGLLVNGLLVIGILPAIFDLDCYPENNVGGHPAGNYTSRDLRNGIP